jgi:predicted ferric reductase
LDYPARAGIHDALHEQVIEAALAGEFRYLDEQVLSERAADHPFCISTSRSSTRESDALLSSRFRR